jgi:hypothetical protein
MRDPIEEEMLAQLADELGDILAVEPAPPVDYRTRFAELRAEWEARQRRAGETD